MAPYGKGFQRNWSSRPFSFRTSASRKRGKTSQNQTLDRLSRMILESHRSHVGLAGEGTCGTVTEAIFVVTSQEDIDSVVGEMKQSKANDFSEIQGRFRSRLSLSSANVYEVIRARRNTNRGLSMSRFLSCRNELAVLNYRLDFSQLFVALYWATFGRGNPWPKTIECLGCRI
jgi:hypothetical protein